MLNQPDLLQKYTIGERNFKVILFTITNYFQITSSWNMVLCISVCVCDWASMESPRRGLTSFSFPVPTNRKPEVNGFRNNFARPEPYIPRNVHDTSKTSSMIGNKYEETLSFEKIREICIQKWVNLHWNVLVLHRN